MHYVVAEPCVDCKDKSCIDVCPVDCIYEGPRMVYIHPDQCVACGACEWACPVEAIFHEDALPAQWSNYASVNADFVRLLGTPERASGARDGADHPFVTNLPAQPVKGRV
jgi:NAD-dependent dihydropyrimidine dehydrogenase PreA subunit